MEDTPETKSLQRREDGFHEIAQTVLRAVSEVAKGVNQIAAEHILSSVKEAYLKGYNDGYRAALRKAYEDQVSQRAGDRQG